MFPDFSLFLFSPALSDVPLTSRGGPGKAGGEPANLSVDFRSGACRGSVGLAALFGGGGSVYLSSSGRGAALPLHLADSGGKSRGLDHPRRARIS